MQIAVVENGEVTKIGHFKELFPDTSFADSGPPEDFMQANNCKVVNLFKPHNKETQKLVSVTPYLENDQVFTVSVENLNQEELAQISNAKADAVRKKRNDLLASSDWTQLNDATVDKATWAVYRQALRDLPQQQGFPDTMTWPTAPSN